MDALSPERDASPWSSPFDADPPRGIAILSIRPTWYPSMPSHARGVLLATVVLLAAGVGCLGGDDDGDATDVPEEDAPPERATTAWSTSDCRAVQPGWTVDREALDELVGPRWTPASASAVPGVDAGPDQGVFFLFGFDCGATSLNGTSVGSTTGGAALVALEAPGDARGVQADAWIAAVEHLHGSETVAEAFRGHHLPVAEGDASVEVEPSPQGTQARLTYETSGGSVDVTAVYGGNAESVSSEVAVVGPDPDWFAVMHGPESADQRETNLATAEASGDTWMQRLDLEATPAFVWLNTAFEWSFTLEHEPWEGEDATGSAGAVAG